jgi:hypothetical protein
MLVELAWLASFIADQLSCCNAAAMASFNLLNGASDF